MVTTFAQAGFAPAYPLELGIQLGTSHFLGDLGGQRGIGRPFLRDTELKAIRPIIGVFGRYNVGAHFAARLDLNFLMLAGNDSWAGENLGFSGTTLAQDDAWYRFYRNLNFRTNVFEANIAGEIIPYNFELGGGYQEYSVLSPYVFIGVGLYHFNPQGLSPSGSWVPLKPLATEGQGIVDGRVPYSLWQINVPMGFGLKWMYNDAWALSLEVGHRLTFTDYIDDVSTDYVDPTIFTSNLNPTDAALASIMARKSLLIDPGKVNGFVSAPGEQRGDPKDNDSYYTISLRFSYFIDPGSIGGGQRYGCPVW